MENNKREVLLRVEHLSQHFGSLKAVDDVSFEIMKGEVFGLVGESGCGKTTTGRSIIKLYDITAGDVYFKGVRICAGIQRYKEAMRQAAEACKMGEISKEEYAAICAENKAAIREAKQDQKHCDKQYQKEQVEKLQMQYLPAIEAAEGQRKAELKAEYKELLRKAKRTKLVTQIQMIFQDPIASLDPRMTVREIISEGLIVQGDRNKQAVNEKVYEMLEMVGLVREHAGRYPHEFSGGQKQRVGVARAVIMEPELIIADEPVSALDVSIQAQVINLLNELRERLGLTILFIAHDLSVVKYFSDRIGVMYFGKMVELADSDELFKNPLHPYTKSLLSAIPLPDPAYEKERKRIVYNPLESHDYSREKPTLREVSPGHFVYCNTEELERYRAELK